MCNVTIHRFCDIILMNASIQFCNCTRKKQIHDTHVQVILKYLFALGFYRIADSLAKTLYGITCYTRMIASRLVIKLRMQLKHKLSIKKVNIKMPYRV